MPVCCLSSLGLMAPNFHPYWLRTVFHWFSSLNRTGWLSYLWKASRDNPVIYTISKTNKTWHMAGTWLSCLLYIVASYHSSYFPMCLLLFFPILSAFILLNISDILLSLLAYNTYFVTIMQEKSLFSQWAFNKTLFGTKF